MDRMNLLPSPEPVAARPRARRSLASEMTLVLGLTVAALVTVLLGVDYGYARAVEQRQIQEHLSAIAASRHAALRTYLRSQQEQVAVIAGRLLLRQSLVDRAAQSPAARQSLALAQQSLVNTDSLLPYMLRVRLADPMGQVIAASPVQAAAGNASEEAAFRAGLRGVHIGLPQRRAGHFEAELAAPVQHEGRALGVLLITADMGPLVSVLGDTTGLGRTGEVALAVRAGDEARSLFPGRRSDRQWSVPLAGFSAVAAALDGREFLGEAIDADGVPVLAAARPMGEGGWGLVAKIDVSEAYAPLVRRGYLVLGLGLSGVLAALAVARLLALRFTRPIVQLVQAAQRVGHGDFAVVLPVSSGNETGELTAGFNQMTAALRSYATAREKAERTLTFVAELQKAFAPLSSAAQIMRVAGERIARHLNLQHCLLAEVDDAADQLTVLHDHHAPGVASLVGRYRMSDFRTDAERRQLAAGQALVIDDLRSGSRSAQQAERYAALGMAALVNAPYLTDGRWKFMLSAVRGEPYAWPADDTELLVELAARIYVRIERARAEEALATSRQRFAGIVELAMDAIVSVGVDQRIVLFNAAAEQMFRCPAAQALGSSIDRFIPQRFRLAHRGHVERFGAGGTNSRAMDRRGEMLFGQRADGEEFPIEASIFKVDAGGERLFTVILRDITERRRAEEELRLLNRDLERRVTERTAELARQNLDVLRQSREIEQARHVLQKQAESLAAASKYKSEFLSNMSHELRTPLNSLLILSRLLADNPDRNLTPKQVEFAQIMHQSGSELLRLINEILDLSRIEAGQVKVYVEAVKLSDLREKIERDFRHVAQSRSLDFSVILDPALPAALRSDPNRLEQVLRNLLANSFKFTHHGSVKLAIAPASEGWTRPHPHLDAAQGAIGFAVSDTGIGIAPDKQQLIFDAFAQADGTTSRNYGGTGLGLSISREIAGLLGGQIALKSEAGQGSTFTLYLPLAYAPKEAAANGGAAAPEPKLEPEAARRHVQYLHPPGAAGNAVEDDRETVATGDAVLLLVENDPVFARLLLGIAHRHAFKGLVATSAASALQLARAHQPAAITLSVTLPDMDGWKLLRCVNQDLGLRHIPVHIVSGEDERPRGLRQGASSYLQKPVSEAALGELFERIRASRTQAGAPRLLIVEDNPATQAQIVQAFGASNFRRAAPRQLLAPSVGGREAPGGEHTSDSIAITLASSAEQGLARLRGERFDCVVLDLRLPGLSGFEFLETVRDELRLNELPIVVYTGIDLSSEQRRRLDRLAESVLVKDARSLDRLLDQASLHLRCPVSALPAPARATLERLHGHASALAGARVLVVDDDMRNVYALFAILENARIEADYADNGRQCLEMLEAAAESDAGYDAVLMDIMMPAMDGYETMRRIRTMPGFASLPLIALTAKAMKGDREKCIAAGASDYLAKPVDAELLLAQLRFWIQR
jgi:PAS domain S-box-containing protein